MDVTVLEPRWRAPVEDAMASRARFDTLVQRMPKGPSRDRLEALRIRLDAGVNACWEIATTAEAAARALDVVDPDRITAQMKDARRRLISVADGSPEAEKLHAEIDTLSTQLRSVGRIWDGLDEASERLRLLELRLDGAVARAAELLLNPATADSVEQDLSHAVDELEALRQAVVALG